MPQAVNRADDLLKIREGFSFEKMIRLILEEQSRLGYGEIELSDQVRGYWDKPDTGISSIEIDNIAYNDEKKIVRFGSCKRSDEAHNKDSIERDKSHIGKFLTTNLGKRFSGWQIGTFLYAPTFNSDRRAYLEGQGFSCRSLSDFIKPYRVF